MNVAINMVTLRGFGSKRVGLGVLSGLRDARQPHGYEAWVPDSWTSQDLEGAPCDLLLHKCKAGTYHKFTTENLNLRRSIHTQQMDCLFSLGDTSIVAAQLPHLLMVQQAYLAYPSSEMDFELSIKFRLKLHAMCAYFRIGVSTVSMFTVQSSVMARRLAQRWGIAPDRIAVVPSSVMLPNSVIPVEPRTPPYICYVASAGHHKNYPVLAAMMFDLVQEFPSLKCYLTVTPEQVPAFISQIKDLQISDSFVFCGSVTSEAAIELMRHAWVCIIPSKLESFGLPYLEAMAVGCPVIAADRDFAHEACGEAVMYADANNGSSFAECVKQLLASKRVRADWSDRSYRQFKKVYQPWTAISQQYLALLSSLM